MYRSIPRTQFEFGECINPFRGLNFEFGECIDLFRGLNSSSANASIHSADSIRVRRMYRPIPRAQFELGECIVGFGKVIVRSARSRAPRAARTPGRAESRGRRSR